MPHFTAEEQIFLDREVGQDAEFLKYRRDAGGAQRLRREARGGAALNTVSALTEGDVAGDDVDQRRFAGPVLPEQDMHLARLEIEIHTIQSAEGTVTLRHPAQNE